MTDVFGTTTEEMRALGYLMVDRVIEHITNIGDKRALTVADAPTLLRQLRSGPAPAAGTDLGDLVDTLVTAGLSTMQHGDHPRYFARVPGPSSFTGVLGDWLTTGFNAIATSWGGGSGPSSVELVAIDWLRQMLGLPAGTQGIALSGGSMANLTALAAARTAIGPGVVYYTDQTHSCVAKALRLLGVPDREARSIDTGTELRLTRANLVAHLDTDAAFGDPPAVVVATAGSTNTGAVDDLEGIAAECAARGVWLHVDAAYGGPAYLTAEGAALLKGIELADSVAIDPHKWLFQPYDLAVLLVTRRGVLDRTFTENPEYLADVTTDVGEIGEGAGGEVDMRNRGPELTRRPRLAKLWLTIAAHGTDAITALVQRGIDNAVIAQRALEADPRWQVVTPASIGIVTFCRADATDAEHVRAAQVVTDSGWAAVTCTTLNGRQVLRLCTINPRTTEADITTTIERLAATF